MHRIVTILLIGLLTVFSAPRAGMSHEMTAMAQDTAMSMHRLGPCPDCPDRMSDAAPFDVPCPHGAICVLFTLNGSLDHRVSRILRPLGYPAPTVVNILARMPGLDLPPPRIGLSLA